MCIQKFDISIKHRSGKCNTNADALSRNPLPENGNAGGSEDNPLPQASVLSLSNGGLRCEQEELFETQRKDESLKDMF